MKYEQPKLDILILGLVETITTSLGIDDEHNEGDGTKVPFPVAF